MYFILLLTERCNLECSYCESRVSRSMRQQELEYDVNDLIDFLNTLPHVGLQLYGGEPLLRLDLVEAILDGVKNKQVSLQTNGLLLDQLPERLFDAIAVICVSIDGPRHVTDTFRGAGVYDKVIAQVTALRERGYRGQIDARMTISPGVQIYEAVRHLTQECSVDFDSVHWQLNACFGAADWRQDHKFIRKWLKRVYDPQIARLVQEWASAIVEESHLVKIVPFWTVMLDILCGQEVDWVRCGAGRDVWTIIPSGEIYACPVLRGSPAYTIGTIADVDPRRIEALPGLRKACAGCEVLGLCGGRCIYASETMRWGEEGFRLICASTKSMIRQLRQVAPAIQEVVKAGRLDPEAYAWVGQDYEVIP